MFVATAWQKRNPAGYAWMLTLSLFFSVPVAYVAVSTHNRVMAMSSSAELKIHPQLVYLHRPPPVCVCVQRAARHEEGGELN